MLSEVKYLARSSTLYRGYFTSRISKFSTQSILKSMKTTENDKAALPLELGKSVDKIHKPSKVAKDLYLYKAKKSSNDGNKPLVLLFQWLYAKPVAVSKYCHLYHDLGMDVLAIRGKLSHFLWPPVGVKLSAELFEYLKLNYPDDQKFIVHAFSVGAYIYTITIHQALEREIETGYFRDRIVAQVFDSVVIGTYDNMSHGITEVLQKSESFRRLVHHTLDLYYNVTHKTTTATYDKLVDHFTTRPVTVPTLVIYSEDDPMCNVALMESILQGWRSRGGLGFDVRTLSWPQSKHAAHLREHREDYVAEWRRLMETVKLL